MHLIELTEAERLEYLGALIDKTNAFAESISWIDTRDQASKIEYAKNSQKRAFNCRYNRNFNKCAFKFEFNENLLIPKFYFQDLNLFPK